VTGNPRSLGRFIGDFYGGLTAAVVALPLALAFGVASGLGPVAGLYGAIAVGFFAAVFGGTPTQISGPTGPMTIVMATIVAQHANSLSEAFAIVVLGGLLQIMFGFARIGRFVSYTPYSVVSGFMSGIGIIIILIQTGPLFGLDVAQGGPVGAVKALSRIPSQFNVDAAAISCVALAIMVLWPERLRALLPPPLVALAACSLLALFVFPEAPVIGTVPTGLPTVSLPVIGLQDLPGILQPAFILALLGSIDSLLTSLVADSITRTRHKSDRELIGQGIGNVVAGLIGGLPGAGATMRTVINVRAGGRSPLSGALHALILLALVLGLAPLAERIPHAVLAGILMKVGWDIIDWGYLKRVRRAPRDKVIVMLTTLCITVFVDLITAVAVGMILAGFATARWMQEAELEGVSAVALSEVEGVLDNDERAALHEYDGRIGMIALRGHFSYASARELVRRAGSVTAGHEVILFDFTHAAHVDTSAALAIEELIGIVLDETKGCVIAGLSGPAEKTLKGLGILDLVPEDHMVATRVEAIRLAGRLIDQNVDVAVSVK
jgi:SulP family sulfate permease